jgi:hypothetical protein
MFRSLLALTLGVALLVPAAKAAPAAAEVKANVHGAATLTLALFALTPTSGNAEVESALLQHVASSGLGEVMGWGQDYYDNVEPAVVNAITTNFQAAFRLLESAFSGATPSFAQLTKTVKQLSGHFEKMRTAVAAPAADAAQVKRQAHVLAGLVVHHLKELPESPLLESPALKLTVGVRTVKAAVAALEAALAALPSVSGQVAPQIAALKALAGQSHATVEALVAKALPLAEAIAAATN